MCWLWSMKHTMKYYWNTRKTTFNWLRPSDEYMRQLTVSQHWFRSGLVTWPAPSHDLNQCWDILNWTLGNKIQWNLNRYSNIFIQENGFENIVWKMAAILSRPQCINALFNNSCILVCIFSWMTIYAAKVANSACIFIIRIIQILLLLLISWKYKRSVARPVVWMVAE